MPVKTLTIDGKAVPTEADRTIMEVAREAGVEIPSLCYLNGVSEAGACRLCLVEVGEGDRLLPSCTTKVHEGMNIRTDTERLRGYRRMIVELMFAERNHVCSVCVANTNCELQDMAVRVGMDHVRYDYMNPTCSVDVSHERYGVDHNRCILCTRCVRVCDEVEGAHTWDIAGRGTLARVITDLNQPWGTASTCTSCGKCVQACPTGALFFQGSTVAEMQRDPNIVAFLVNAREKRLWDV